MGMTQTRLGDYTDQAVSDELLSHANRLRFARKQPIPTQIPSAETMGIVRHGFDPDALAPVTAPGAEYHIDDREEPLAAEHHFVTVHDHSQQ